MVHLNTIAKNEIVNVKFASINSNHYSVYVAVYHFSLEEAKERGRDYFTLNANNLFQLVSKIDEVLEPRKIHQSDLPIPKKIINNMAPRPKPLSKEEFTDLGSILNIYNSTNKRN